jgi:hypothetical protein
MKKELNNALDSFLNKEVEKKEPEVKQEKIVEKDGLIERIDKTYITESGKILLRD